MKNLIWLILLILVAPLPAEREITIAVAANVQFAMEELKEAFEQTSGLTIKTIYNSSGKLTAQIQNGAPFDVFLSADMKYPASLHEAGWADSLPAVYAYGSLALWTMKNLDLWRWKSLLLEDSLRKIAIANPLNAPYGGAAVQTLQYYRIYDLTDHKLVYGRNVSQVNQYIVSRAADAGFTAKSVVLSPEMAGQGKWIEIDPDAYSPIEQGAVILKHGHNNNPEAAEKFYEFLFSETAQHILQKYGYRIP